MTEPKNQRPRPIHSLSPCPCGSEWPMVACHGQSLYPQGVKPDLPVDLSAVDKRQIFLASREKGMGPFVFETERPHLNEAALIAGTNPEIEALEQRLNWYAV